MSRNFHSACMQTIVVVEHPHACSMCSCGSIYNSSGILYNHNSAAVYVLVPIIFVISHYAVVSSNLTDLQAGY